MTPVNCTCGFTELADETLTDHLVWVFTPEDGLGNDGMLHEETGHRTCLCGLAATTPDDLDQHFLKVFTPDDAIGRDGNRHEALTAG
jgi:hypothetical protein